MAAAVMLLNAAAFAAAPLTPREIVDQVAVPLAVANDPEAGICRSYSAEELAEIVRVLKENGIEPEETCTVMQMARNGLGYYEEIVIREICERAYGTEFWAWPVETQQWYNGQMEKIGSFQTAIPGPDNRTFGEAAAFGLGRIREEYGQDLPLDDRNIWRMHVSFFPAGEENPEDSWSVVLEPLDPDYSRYSVRFRDSDPSGSASAEEKPPRDWSQPYTGRELLMEYYQACSWSEEQWPQAVRRKVHERMQQAELDPDGFFYPVCKGLQLTGYPEPDGRDISREEAVRIARDALQKDRAALNSAVLTEYGGERSWLIGMVIWTPDQQPADEEDGQWVVTVDSLTGDVRSVKEAYDDAAFVPEAAYEKAREGRLGVEDAIRFAAEAIRKVYPGPDPMDEAEYTVTATVSRGYDICFRTRNIRHGDVSAAVGPDGTVSSVTAEEDELHGDNLFLRYWKVYGYYGRWEQDRWVCLEKDMADLEPETVAGKALKATHYPEEASVTIRHGQAQELGRKASGSRAAEVNTCVLVDAEPHPVWIMRILIPGYDGPVIGIDAETGETVFTEPYTVDETPDYVLYSMPETWRALERELSGEAAAPALRPDGKPWFWGMDYAPEEVWDRAEALMQERGIPADGFEDLAEEWDRAYGNIDFWPQEYQALYDLYLKSEESQRDSDGDRLLFPDPDRRSQEEIGEIARCAFHEIADAEMGKERVDGLRIGSTLYSDSRDPVSEGKKYGQPVWWVWFYEWAEEDRSWSDLQGCVILDLDGKVLACLSGDI